MAKISQKEIILKHFQKHPNEKFMSYDLIQKNFDNGWVGISGDRRARELAEEGVLLKERHGKYERYWLAEAHIKPEPKQKVPSVIIREINGQPVATVLAQLSLL